MKRESERARERENNGSTQVALPNLHSKLSTSTLSVYKLLSLPVPIEVGVAFYQLAQTQGSSQSEVVHCKASG